MRAKSSRILMATFGLATLGIMACDEARELIDDLHHASDHHGSDSGKGGSAPTPPPSDDCVGKVTTGCDPVAFSKLAADACAAKGLPLKGGALDDQNAPAGQCLGTYYCCDIVAPPPPPDPFAGAPIPGPSHLAQFKCCPSDTGCDVVQLGDDATCLDAAAWEAKATATCAANGQTLAGLGLYGACTP
jgi:hypothetical protein